MKTKTTMRFAIEQILERMGQLEAFRNSSHFAVKIHNEPFMPLSIERHDNIITVTHYYEQNGDLVPDPDMEFVNIGNQEWLPTAIQHSTGHYERAGEYSDGKWQFDQRSLRDLQLFSQMWARNLLAQGFAIGKRERAPAQDP